MRMVRSMLVAVSSLVSTTAAFGNVSVWYTATPNNALSLVTTQGAPGTELGLSCLTATPAACSWAVTMNVQIAGGLTGWGTDLFTAAGNGVSATGAANSATNPFPAGNSAPGVGGAGAALLVGSGAFTFNAPFPTGLQSFITFTLNRSMAQGDLSVASVFAKHNTDWGNADVANSDPFGFDAAVRYADSAPMNGSGTDDNGAFRVGDHPVIHINGVPEPASLALLVLGGVFAVRRRR